MLPEILSERLGADRIQLELHVPRGLAHFEGHFPGHPILPGVVQIDWAIRLARSRFDCPGTFCAMENVRFQSVVLPGVTLSLVLTLRDAGARLAFAYSSGPRKCSSGTLVFRPS